MQITISSRVYFALFVACFCFSLWAATVGWQHSIIEAHGFRQTQTALTAEYLQKGGPFLAYETPILGPPWSIPMELPVYQWLAAKSSSLLAMPLEQAGRLVARIFFYLTLIPLFFSLAKIQIPKQHLWIFLSLYLVSPHLLFWSRTFMIESTALFFAVAYFAAGAAWIERPKWKWLFLGATLGILGATVKITTFFTFTLALALLYISHLYQDSGWRVSRWLRVHALLFALAFALIPLFALLVWNDFSDALKAANPMADAFITTNSLHKWTFGTFSQRLDGNFWYMLFRKQIHGAIGHRTTWIISLVLIFFVRKRFLPYLLCSLLFLASPLVFTNLHIVHDYYAYANVLFLIIALGVCISGLLERRGRYALAGHTFLLAALALCLREYMGKPFHDQLLESPAPLELAQQIDSNTDPNDVLVIFGFDWHPMFNYYAHRRALMNRNLSPSAPPMLKAYSYLTAYRIGAVVFCGDAVGDQKLITEARLHLHFAEKPLSPIYFCAIYKLETIDKESRGRNTRLQTP